MGLPHLRDLSNWQPAVDWRRERREIAGCYVKVAQGMSFVDPTAKTKIAGATRARVPIGGYLYCVPGSGSPEAQADRLLRYAPLSPLAHRLRPCLDCEANPLGLNPGQLAAWYLGAAIRVHKRLGCWPTIYGSPSYLEAFATLHPNVFGLCPLWVADYGVKTPRVPAPWTHWCAWQWTESFRDPAVGRVDDSFVADLAALRVPLSAAGAAAKLLAWRGR